MVKAITLPAPDTADLPPLPALLVAYAPRARRHWHALCWQLDRRLSAVVRRGGEPTIAAIRLAWWDAVLVDNDPAKGGGEPLVEAWRAVVPERAAPLAGALIDGWRTLLGEEALSDADLDDFAAKRGGGLFHLIAAAESAAAEDALIRAGTVWGAVGFLPAMPVSPRWRRRRSTGARVALAAGPAVPQAAMPKPLRLLFDLAAADARSGRIPAGGFQGRHYRALLWRSLLP